VQSGLSRHVADGADDRDRFGLFGRLDRRDGDGQAVLSLADDQEDAALVHSRMTISSLPPQPPGGVGLDGKSPLTSDVDIQPMNSHDPVAMRVGAGYSSTS